MNRQANPTDRYAKYFFLLSGLTLASVGGFNLLIDPENVFRLASIPGLNAEKPLIAKQGIRRPKAIDLETGQYDTLILGTSRSFGGLDPLHPTFEGHRVYNAGLPGTNFYETQKVFDFARQHQAIKQVFIELDFTGFSDWRTVDADYKYSRFAGRNTLPSDISKSLSFTKLTDSWETIRFNQSGQPGQYTEQGFRRFRTYGDKPGDGQLEHRKLFTFTTKGFIQDHDRPYNSRDRLNRLQQLITDAQTDGIEVHLFISPLHAHLLEALHEVGQFEQFETWKQDVVAIAEASEQAIAVWDFSGYNSVTTETIPPPASSTQMKWYSESSHYTKELGDIMLSLMIKNQSPEGAPQDFGVKLSSENIEPHLAQIRADRDRYHQEQPSEVAEVHRLAREVTARESSQNQQARR